MLLAVDIGNTNTSCGLFRGGRLVGRFELPTALGARRTGFRRRLRARLGGRRIEQALICSVVPQMTPVMAGALRRLGVRRIRVVGRDVKVPLRNRYRYPRQVGHDRLVGAYAAWKEFGLRRGTRDRGQGRDCIVCDFGTAITIDLVTRRGEYLGGVIAPGLQISLDALASRTALLPRVALRKPPELLGRDTANSIRSGLIHGAAALCDGLVARLKRHYSPSAVVVATGGSSPLITHYYSREIDHLRPSLVLEGLFYLSI